MGDLPFYYWVKSRRTIGPSVTPYSLTISGSLIAKSVLAERSMHEESRKIRKLFIESGIIDTVESKVCKSTDSTPITKSILFLLYCYAKQFQLLVQWNEIHVDFFHISSWKSTRGLKWFLRKQYSYTEVYSHSGEFSLLKNKLFC